MTVFLASPAHANEFAGGLRDTLAGEYVTKFQGVQVIRANPPTQSGVAFAHPHQVGFSGDEFMGAGAYKGAGAGHCTSKYSGKWNVYVDGERPNGTYFCRTILTGAVGLGDPLKINLKQGSCGSNNGWVTKVNGSREDCRHAWGTSYANWAGVSLEEAPTILFEDFNIDVQFHSLQYYGLLQASWVDLWANELFANPDYRVDQPGTRKVNAYLGVMEW